MADLHVMMFPFFAFGHVAPFAQLSNKLSSHGIRITFLTIPGFVPKVKTIMTPSPKTEIVELEVCPSLGLPRDLAGTAELSPSEAGKLITAIDLTRPRVETLLSELKPDVVLFDFAQYWIPSIAAKHGVKSMRYSVLLAVSVGYYAAVQTQIGEEGSASVEDIIKPPPGFPLLSRGGKIPLLKPYAAKGLLYGYTRRENGNPSVADRVSNGLVGCTGFIIKSCHEMEGPYLDFLEKYMNMPFLLTGPQVPEPTPLGTTLDEKTATWLARFPAKSVVFCSFGSETFLAREKIRELALGLELTGLPFFLVLNFSKNVDARAELENALPLGFLERTKDRGLIHVGWVPQTLILEHVNVGCYLCHAGLSSVIEALVNDCQLVLLPQKLDQFFNSRLVGENGTMKTGVEVFTRDEDGYFGKEDICKAVKTVMVDVDQELGKSIRANQRKWNRFLRDEAIQEKFISDMVVELKRILIK